MRHRTRIYYTEEQKSQMWDQIESSREQCSENEYAPSGITLKFVVLGQWVSHQALLSPTARKRTLDPAGRNRSSAPLDPSNALAPKRQDRESVAEEGGA